MASKYGLQPSTKKRWLRKASKLCSTLWLALLSPPSRPEEASHTCKPHERCLTVNLWADVPRTVSGRAGEGRAHQQVINMQTSTALHRRAKHNSLFKHVSYYWWEGKPCQLGGGGGARKRLSVLGLVMPQAQYVFELLPVLCEMPTHRRPRHPITHP